MRRFPLSVLLVAICLLPVGIGSGASAHSHALIGAAPALAGAARLARSIHERFDGSGYPDGLAGDQIPLGARIIAVCDAFTAMTFPRPYAAQLSVPEAIAELRRGAGTQFDPTVVDALANLVTGLEWPPQRATGATSTLDPLPDRS